MFWVLYFQIRLISFYPFPLREMGLLNPFPLEEMGSHETEWAAVHGGFLSHCEEALPKLIQRLTNNWKRNWSFDVTLKENHIADQ